ncbi:TIGR01777 family oxidoreductase [Leucothrix mucor]|uniref:TIGR01777 family oxidoreductase n=1 Tax=Leucothrix mucor TaxID=45248 RepID=UPI0003B6BBA4|nr:TIGR01777 family oxidoreductase [Leucothrix mucor]
MSQKHILLTGGSGFIGQQLVPTLLNAGHTITIFTRNPKKTSAIFQQQVATIDNLDDLTEDDHFDAVINLAGQGIGDQRWTDTVKQQLRDSRLITTADLVEYLKRAKQKPEVFISGSAIGVYGLHGDEKLDEQASGDDSFSSKLCRDWEAQAAEAEALGIRCCYLRTGVVLGKNGGALSKMLPPFKMALGGPMGSGQQWMSWVHMDDLVCAILYTLETPSIKGPVNGTAPNPVTNKEFSKILGAALNRPAIIPMPEFVLKLMMGEMAEELLLSGQRVVPAKLTQSGFEFKYPHLDGALRDIIQH